jgi:ribosomal protein L6P/L9E
MIEVTPENTVVVRQEKDNETYIVDESENHDRAMTSGEVDAAIDAFINGVKAQVKTEKQK